MISNFNNNYKESSTLKTSHITHLEDLIYDEGYEGGLKILYYLKNIFEEMKGNVSKKEIKTKAKIDGAPSLIFCKKFPGINGSFVATKGLFNKVPLYFRTKEEILNKYFDNPKLIKIFSLALDILNDLPIPDGEMWKGDFLFDQESLKYENIDGISYITFTPNTITYAVPANSEIGKKIKKSKIGIAFHTRYSGPDLLTAEKNATFDLKISDYNIPDHIFAIDVDVPQIAGIFTLTKEETDLIEKKLEECEFYLENIKDLCRKIENDKFANLLFNQFENVSVRKSNIDNNENNIFLTQFGKNVEKYIEDFYNWILEKMEKEISEKKLEKTKIQIRQNYESFINTFFKNPTLLKYLFEFQKNIVIIKNIFLNKLKNSEKIYGLFSFLRDPSTGNLKVTEGEGFVIADVNNDIVKLVDRLSFSKMNFLMHEKIKTKEDLLQKNLEDLSNQDLEDLFLLDGDKVKKSKLKKHINFKNKNYDFFQELNLKENIKTNYKNNLKFKLLFEKVKKNYLKNKFNYIFSSLLKEKQTDKSDDLITLNYFSNNVCASLDRILTFMKNDLNMNFIFFDLKNKKPITDVKELENKQIKNVDLVIKVEGKNENIRNKEFFQTILKEELENNENLVAYRITSSTIIKNPKAPKNYLNILDEYLTIENLGKTIKQRMDAFKRIQLYYIEKDPDTQNFKIISFGLDTKPVNTRSENTERNETWQAFFISYFITHYNELKSLENLLTDFSYLKTVTYNEENNEIIIQTKNDILTSETTDNQFYPIINLFQKFFENFAEIEKNKLQIKEIDVSLMKYFIEYFIGAFVTVEKLRDYFDNLNNIYIATNKNITFDNNSNILQESFLFNTFLSFFKMFKHLIGSSMIDAWCQADIYIYKIEFENELQKIENSIKMIIEESKNDDGSDIEKSANTLTKINNIFAQYITNDEKEKRLLFPLSLKQGGTQIKLKMLEDGGEEAEKSQECLKILNNNDNFGVDIKIHDILGFTKNTSKNPLISSSMIIKNQTLNKKVTFYARNFHNSDIYDYSIDVEIKFEDSKALSGKIPRIFLLSLRDRNTINSFFEGDSKNKIGKVQQLIQDMESKNVEEKIKNALKELDIENIGKKLKNALLEIKNSSICQSLKSGDFDINPDSFANAFKNDILNFLSPDNLKNIKEIEDIEFLFKIKILFKNLFVFLQVLDFFYYAFEDTGGDKEKIINKLQNILLRGLRIIGGTKIPYFELS